jgi:hypothetical protein
MLECCSIFDERMDEFAVVGLELFTGLFAHLQNGFDQMVLITHLQNELLIHLITPNPLPTITGDFADERMVGSGGFGVVYRVRTID